VILCEICGIYLIVDIDAWFFHKCNFLVDTTSLNMSFMMCLYTAKPGTGATFIGSDIEILINTNNPNRYRVSQRTVSMERSDLQLFCIADLSEFIACPCGYQNTSLGY